MLTKRLLAIALVLPFSALSATAYAGSTITDKSYWPNEARRSLQSGTVVVPGEPFAYDPTLSRLPTAATPSVAGSAWRYQGGPKSR